MVLCYFLCDRFALGFGVSTLTWNGAVSTLRERVSLYQDRLQGASPDQAAQKMAYLEKRVKELEPHPQRHLTDDQKGHLIASLTPLAEEIKVIDVFVEQSSEPQRFAVEFFPISS
jgi:hypothetical protein